MGLGTFGGGSGAVRFLLKHGAKVTLTDLRDERVLKESLEQFDISQLHALVLGEHREIDFSQADYLVVSPAVHRTGNRFLEIAAQHGAVITSEMNLFWQLCRAKKIVVTGTVGKSTTATLIHQGLLAASIPSRLGGNIGISLLPEVYEIAEHEWVVLELSSFQLAHLNELECQPDVSVITNFAPNHLDWHRTLEHYEWSKQSALRWQTTEQVSVLHAETPCLTNWSTTSKQVWFGKELLPGQGVCIDSNSITITTKPEQKLLLSELAPCLQFSHQYQNVAAALGALFYGVGLDIQQVKPAFTGFQSLPHRFEVIVTNNARRVINDSKATTPEATIAALSSLTGNVILIAGGKDKQVDLSDLYEVIANQVTAVALIGDTATQMEDRIGSLNPAIALKVCSVFEEAVDWALLQSTVNSTILLSPGCASHAEFSNYEDRGAQFRRLILSKT